MVSRPMRLDPMSLEVETFVPAGTPGGEPEAAASVLFTYGDCSSHCFVRTNQYEVC